MSPFCKQPIDQYQRLQGRQFALDLVESFGQKLKSAKGVTEAITRLSAAAENKPESYTLGINDIVDVLSNALKDSAGEKND